MIAVVTTTRTKAVALFLRHSQSLSDWNNVAVSCDPSPSLAVLRCDPSANTLDTLSATET